jgi:UDPglucose 6-dehydrogenase
LLRGVIETNDQHYARIADKVIAECGGSVRGLTVAAWGLTFKANTDDLRDSPAIKILLMLGDAGATIRAYDPTAKSGYEAYPWIAVMPSALDACVGADALVLLTEWSEFAAIEPREVAARMTSSRVVDSRNVLDKAAWLEAGFVHRGVGR